MVGKTIIILSDEQVIEFVEKYVDPENWEVSILALTTYSLTNTVAEQPEFDGKLGKILAYGASKLQGV